ncbi:hypothetical protein QFW96_05180 [Saccharopolyspora sp. TS4A08]|uniref:Uncharacterized protein n=1 Tax=Saccharopolyspora ipomoeae TaxID=3042027 RepID=A0ABT6PJ24_9PSEU|nr:hypothetical protein [Saccharopolyspora sp. TS4A08]MDI2027988.1 hypothetical protein [Saccharopolyspora sp. TS4A08]
MPCPSATLVVWSSAWLHGAAASDDVLDALQTWGEVQEFRAADDELAARLDLPGPDDTPAGPALLLAALRRAGASTGQLALPVPGDARGLDGSSPLSKLAMRTGEAAVLPEAGLGLVPERIAEGVLRWTVFATADLAPAEHLPIGEAEHGMSSAMREAATALIDLGVAKQRPGVREEIARTIAAKPAPDWPESIPQRTLRILQRATEVEAILWVATEDSPGGALSASAIRARTDALRPLFDSVRAARRACVAEMVRVLAEQAPHS